MNLKLKPVTNENRKEVLLLEILESQKKFIETTEKCLKEADELLLWNPVGIYNGEKLVGFAMYGLFENEGNNGRVWLDRFLIDKKYQKLGYGKEALDILIKRINAEYHCTKIYLSIYEENKDATHMYESRGFQFNGEFDLNGEKVMVLKNNKSDYNVIVT